MNRTVPWTMDDGAEDGRPPAGGHRATVPPRDWIDEAARPPEPAGRPDHTAEMRAIAAQLAALSASGPRGSDGRGDANRGDALRDAVAAIARRQADLDGQDAAASRPSPRAPARRPAPQPAATAEPAPPPRPEPREASGLRRAGIDLSSEVSQTFARFSRDLRDAIAATDARPAVETLGREVRQIGRAVDGIGAGLPGADALARISEQTREMRDILRSSTARTAPLDAVERQVASLETRLGRLAALPSTPVPPDLAGTMAEVRALLDGFDPGATMTALETRLGAITDRIERSLGARGPSDLIEGLSRRVDEIHSSLRSQLAEAAVDTKPLEGLVRSLSDRIGQAREASSDFQQLEAAVRDAAARIDGAAAGLDPRGVQAVEAQVARLGERLDRSEASLRSLDGVEQTLGELFAQFEVTRQVAIDAAETAARTAARDTLRAALQNPNLAHRAVDASAAVDQMARSIDDIRAQQDTAERRTQSALADIRMAVDRLVGQMAGARAAAPDEPVRPRPAADAPRDSGPADLLIEPGAGRAGAARPGTRPDPDRAVTAPTPETDGPASFIAAARRAAQVAQASAASTASAVAATSSDRRPPPRAAGPRARPAAARTGGTLGRARVFLSERRRPILLGLAALVLLVGALEVVKLSADPAGGARSSEAAAPVRTHVAAMAAPAAEAPARPVDAPAKTPAAVLPPAAVPAPPPLPAFAGGTSKPLPPPDGIPAGLRTAAASGDLGAEYEVGLRYAEGRGVPRDPKQALAWFEKAAAGGLAPAEYRLGSAYEKGVGVDRDPAQAMSWYGRAAEAGNVRAMHNLAVMSAEGAGGKPDYAKAAQWFGKASAYGVRDSQFNLAILYARGLGIEQSLPQSYTWFAIAAAEGDEDAGKKRDEVATKLDPQALASAKAASDAFHAGVPLPAANEVAPPAGGWDAGPARSGPSAPNAKVSQL